MTLSEYELRVTPTDIGRSVLYHPRLKGEKPKQGIIHSFNDHYVFVLFLGDHTPKACRRIDLEYVA